MSARSAGASDSVPRRTAARAAFATTKADRAGGAEADELGGSSVPTACRQRSRRSKPSSGRSQPRSVTRSPASSTARREAASPVARTSNVRPPAPRRPPYRAGPARRATRTACEKRVPSGSSTSDGADGHVGAGRHGSRERRVDEPVERALHDGRADERDREDRDRADARGRGRTRPRPRGAPRPRARATAGPGPACSPTRIPRRARRPARTGRRRDARQTMTRLVEVGEALFADAAHVAQLVDGPEAAAPVALGDDRLGERRPDAGQRLELRPASRC